MSPAIQKRRPTRKPGPKPPVKGAHHAPPSGLYPAIERDASGHVLQALARKDPGVWFETYGRIVDKDGNLIRPKLNILQRRVLEAYRYCRDNDLPCSIITCKPRQRGSTTFGAALVYHVEQSAPVTTRACVIGGKDKQVDNVWTILDTYATHDKCSWPRGKAEVLEKEIKFGESAILRETAGNPDAGRAHTFRAVIVTELGRWREAGVSNAAKVLSGFLACCPRRPGTLRLIESTAQGIGGEFHTRYWRAVTLAEFKAGRRSEGGFIRVFAGWWEFEESRVPLTADEAKELKADLDDEERAICERYDLDLEQLAWRRQTIRDELNGDADLFKQEYPANEEEAFLSSGRPRFNRAGLEAQAVLAKAAQDDLRTGDLSLSEDFRVSWAETPEEECVYHRYETPKVGRRYLLVLDPMTGEQATGENPDCHSVFVLRVGFVDEHGQWHAPAVAMRIRPPRKNYKHACRWEADVLTEAIYRAALYYGNCRIVIEMNKDLGVLELLKAKRQIPGAPHPRLYEREVFNEKEERTLKVYGWMTTTGNRESLITDLATAIRETGSDQGGIQIHCPHAVAECTHFERDSKGKSAAAAGWHDDDVLALAIGLKTLGHATVYREARVARADPPEIRKITTAHRAKRRPGMYS